MVVKKDKSKLDDRITVKYHDDDEDVMLVLFFNDVPVFGAGRNHETEKIRTEDYPHESFDLLDPFEAIDVFLQVDGTKAHLIKELKEWGQD